MTHISVHVIIIFLFNFPIYIFFNIYSFFKIFTLFPTFFYPLPFHSSPYYPLPSTLTSLFISPLPFTLSIHLPTTHYLNIILHLSLHLHLFFGPLLFTTSYYKFVILSSILYIFFPKKKRFSLSLSLNFLVDFFFPLIFALCW